MLAASPAASLPGRPNEPLVRGLGDELVVTLAHQVISDIGMHDVFLTV